MTEFRHVTDQLSVSPQITLEDLTRAAALGFKSVINNRPDGEDSSQPTSDAVAAAAKAAGLAYAFIPVRGTPTPAQVAAEKAVLDELPGPVLAFCRSGTRSIVTWSLGQAEAGADRGELIKLGQAAGYDLSGVLG
jgi:uncharacterized protein (TIGR01244 family)